MARNSPGDYRPSLNDWHEIRADEIPPIRGTDYGALLAELVLRLEATPADRALRKVYPSGRKASSIQARLKDYVRKHDLPTDALIVVRRTVGPAGHLYVQRGPAFRQLEVVDGVVQRVPVPHNEA